MRENTELQPPEPGHNLSEEKPNQMRNKFFWGRWKSTEQLSAVTTSVAVLVVGIGAIIPSILYVQAASAGALGGLVHEIAQSGGKFFFIQKRKDGLYLGSLTGMVLGSISGLLILQGFLPTSQVCPTADIPQELESQCQEFVDRGQKAANTPLILEMFLAGVALKGISEAAVGNEVPEESDEELTRNRQI